MLHIQRLLRSDPDGLELIKVELGINVYDHPDLPLVGFKYSQIHSPKLHPVVRECRGLVLEHGTWDMIAPCMRRFFNVGEIPEEVAAFNWDDFYCNTKEDGSLQILFHYAGRWHVNTSGSFGLGHIQRTEITWRDMFWSTSGIDRNDLDVGCTFIFELCTIYNKVVRRYPEPTTFLLTAFRGYDEMSPPEVDELARGLGVPRPDAHHFSSLDDVTEFLIYKQGTDPTYEGVVIRDNKGLRLKYKSNTYLSLHRMKGESGNIFRPKYIVPFILSNEAAELLCYFPEVAEIYAEYKSIVDLAYEELEQVWAETHMIPDQKRFALSIKGRTRFADLLFQIRKELGTNQTSQHLKEKWLRSEENILKKLFK